MKAVKEKKTTASAKDVPMSFQIGSIHNGLNADFLREQKGLFIIEENSLILAISSGDKGRLTVELSDFRRLLDGSLALCPENRSVSRFIDDLAGGAFQCSVDVRISGKALKYSKFLALSGEERGLIREVLSQLPAKRELKLDVAGFLS